MHTFMCTLAHVSTQCPQGPGACPGVVQAHQLPSVPLCSPQVICTGMRTANTLLLSPVYVHIGNTLLHPLDAPIRWRESPVLVPLQEVLRRVYMHV
jgi:hypothetical protein